MIENGADLSGIILPDVPISLANSTLVKLAVGILVIIIIGIILNIYISKNIA